MAFKKSKQPITWTNERRKLSDLIPWERNPRTIKNAQAERLVDSVETFGQVETLAVGPGNALYNGHQRASVLAGQYGMDYEVDVRVASRELTERERQQLTVYLHRGATGEWVFPDLLTWDHDDLITWGFDVEELNISFGDEPTTAGTDTEPQVSKADELQKVWQTQLGQLWALGEHRIICGDCTDAAIVERLMGEEKAHLLLTDPPYGIKRDKGFEGFEGFGGFGAPIARRQYVDDWDSVRPQKSAFDALLVVAKKSIIFGGNFFADILPQSKHWLVWDKLNTMPTFGDCELAWTNIERDSVKKYTVQYNGLIGKEKERFHPTQKPVAIMAAILGDYTDEDDLVFEPFSGSGTTIIASQNLGRKCRAIELSPAYVAVALQRFLDHTGIKPELID